MMYMIFIGLISMVLGMVGVASHPSPYFAAFGLVLAAAAGCWVLVSLGMDFLSLILFLIYLGGMLVVFANSAALAAEPYPEAWGSWSVVLMCNGYVEFCNWFWFNEGADVYSMGEFSLICCDWGGVAVLYDMGGGVLLVLGWVLLITLFIVLELTRGVGVGTVCAV
uniref:NADH-ubiquinone oxidoreductase chain 6 n=1 Tax=Idiocranium cf. russeli BMNH 2008.409 TaxID=1415578 RepID=W5RH06_9AMPH|nr:NADH dehydrogenase subunit 6 [Idiocranium cf. russeli BMNH 2008.409]